MNFINLKIAIIFSFLMFQFTSNAIEVNPKLDVDSLISVGRDSLNNPVKARRLFFKAYDIAKQGYFIKEEAIALNLIGQTYYNQKYYDQAINYFQKSLKVLFQMGQKRKIANMMKKIGLAYLNNNQKLKSAEYYNFAVKIYEQLNLDEKKAETLIELGFINSLSMNYDKSAINYKEALEIYKSHNNTIGAANAYNQLGVAYNNMANYKKAQENFLLAKEIYENENDYYGLVRVLNNYSNTLIKIRQFSRAIKTIKEAEKYCENKNSDLYANILINLGIVYYNQGKFSMADLQFKIVNNISDTLLSKDTKSLLYRELYRVSLRQNKTKIALKYFKKYIAVSDSMRSRKPLEYENIVSYGDNLTIAITIVGVLAILILIIWLVRVIKQRDSALDELKKIKEEL